MFDIVTIKDVKINVGALVKTLRSQAAITQGQLAQELNLSRVTIQNLESGQNSTLDTLLKVLQYFDLLQSFNNYIATEKQNNNQPSLY